MAVQAQRHGGREDVLEQPLAANRGRRAVRVGRHRQDARLAEQTPSVLVRQRYAADASNRTARRSFNGLPALGDELVNIVVKPAAGVDAARV